MAGPARTSLLGAGLVLAVALVAAGGSAPPPSSPSPPPVFPGRVELVAVDVHVTDREGRPVEDLRPEEFEVTVGGRPRRIASADLVRYAAPSATARSAATGRPASSPEVERPRSSSNAAPPGRLVVIVPDTNYLSVSGAHAAAEAAKAFLARLAPSDRVALVTLPVGPKVDFTADHARVADGLDHVMGALDGSFRDTPSRGGTAKIGLAEAFAMVEDYDLGVREEAVVRNCGATEDRLPGGRGNSCVADLERRGRRLQMEAEGKTAATLGTLERLFQGLAPFPGEKTVVLVTQGLVAGAALGVVDAAHEMRGLAAEAAKARVTLHVLHIDRPVTGAFDVTRQEMPHAVGEDARLMATGAELLAGETGGTLFRAMVTAHRAFDRLALQTSSAWLLSFEPAADDADGKPHQIRVKVRRPGLTVRARPQFVVAHEAVLDARARLERTLDAPLAMADIPLTVAAYVVGEPVEGRVRVLMGVEAGGSGASREATIAYRVVDAKGRLAASAVEEARLEAAGPDGVASFGTSFVVPPGTYTVKVAVTDASGGVGSVEHVVEARLLSAGALALSDVVLAHPAPLPGGGAVLEVDGRLAPSSVRAYVEVRATTAGAAAAGAPEVRFEIARVGGGPAERMTGALVTDGKSAGQWRAEAAVDLAGLAPGAYDLRAVVTRGSDEVARVSRAVTID